MVVSAAVGASGAVLVVAAAAVLAVLVSGWVRPAATVAVLLAAGTLLFGAPAPMYSALAGLAAAGYLVLAHNGGRASVPVMSAAVTFAAVASLAVVVPLEVRWLPLAAPLVMFGAFMLALSPFLRDRTRG
ncbi:hypothetical protein [Mycobacterium sp. SMC-4]|uniref:hypothetical protein n=1 Tax=Mycobacterium sp. SMC-4 TaxID=2857059 RepID=UPI0021B39022|nr:hypothetical protein [Mycobacterium sp. SMC-4]